MIGLDTNVLVRYLTQDDPSQAKAVNRLMAEYEKSGQTLWISQIVLCELIWVLESCYDLSKEQIIEVLTTLLQVKQLTLEGEASVYEALVNYREHKKSDFSDCLIGHQNYRNGCSFTYTFDKEATKLTFFRLLK